MNHGFLQDVLAGLRLPQKTLPPKYFYDAKGSEYFDQICQLDEYYPYRTELGMLPDVAGELKQYFSGKSLDNIQLVEFGAGSLHKVKPLLKKLPVITEFVAVDISGEHLKKASADLAESFPNLQIKVAQGDFTQPIELALSQATSMGFFPGSTIGNFEPEEACEFLRSARTTLGKESYMLMGVDTKKDEQMLERAYNDSKDITARFNKNILTRMNRELDANFHPDQFEHLAIYNQKLGRIEMHLRSCVQQEVEIAGESFQFKEGETIHTENSYKYYPEEFDRLASSAGWKREKIWLAPDGIFAIMLLHNADKVRD
ncbi:MAG TPA: L-histidine N(alpha)-methyltransferase [Idiomarina abyssalis]|jgi:dimethylhistidine N-methyltransferase|uniref:L-histidine N(alpha)-methyltransferase n=1 Tax=Idiomarina TaxID=135575 RepID=UPI000C6B9222|nr:MULTISPECIES: L-histidine N(alpha)-methyltransferase [Idiomarina]MAB20820.1 L-histidine N(alpha)-methyltransferase [Idiomarina sp.]MBH93684.1 L-histidine N(alpha)-methyltransferase [Idiomarina sp.]MDA6067434.1 L-histidine N(alpha)-methyltransferase [Idiomarina abyssalis]HAS14411.1 L-histidine N(alpha)-methyltransferase [Idiomarina abyssalis]|tara:strand:+ start:1534 stop:2478 length:945 start_codon:yes stop_codon:yes gene_type:complete